MAAFFSAASLSDLPPPYLVAFLFFAIAFPGTRLHFASLRDAGQFVSHLCLIHNFDARWFFGVNPAYWSIAVEVQLYALYPLLLALVARFGWRRSLIGIAAIEILLRLTDGVLLAVHGTGLPVWLGGSPFFYWFSWSLGAFMAECHVRGRTILVPRFFLYAIGFAAIACWFVKPLAGMSFLLFALFTTGVIAKLLIHPDQKLPVPDVFWKHLSKVGLWSYSLYLLHQPFIFLLPRVVGKFAPGVHIQPLVMFVFCIMLWVLLVPLACLSYQYCELSGISFGKRFYAPKAPVKSPI